MSVPAVDQLLTHENNNPSLPARLTFSRNVFVPLTTACRYTCEYCVFYDPPGEASLLAPSAVREILKRGYERGCTEALFTFGDDPDDRYTAIHEQLSTWGYDSIHEYLVAVSEMALDIGLLPHANPGDQTHTAMAAVAPVTASMGVMLETTAAVRAHAGPRGKDPEQRLATIETAGKLGVPFTTGLLVGIGETRRDRAESLRAIAQLHAEYGHIQEVIIQPVTENERWTRGTPDPATLEDTVRMARAALPSTVSIQAPPNIAPLKRLITAGVDDLGGISPVTDDHINPAHAWPRLSELRSLAVELDVPLRERLPVHERYLPETYRAEWFAGTPAAGEWISDRIVEVLETRDWQQRSAGWNHAAVDH